ncbi:hypothetical protein [Paenibacillus sp. DYY-L-2]|uniref:hypothetical protein n=1 Tax=Paenibacillus sp. DYY-L-2 TaxID=3447013 RepID=UPI003F4FD3D3
MNYYLYCTNHESIDRNAMTGIIAELIGSLANEHDKVYFYLESINDIQEFDRDQSRRIMVRETMFPHMAMPMESLWIDIGNRNRG